MLTLAVVAMLLIHLPLKLFFGLFPLLLILLKLFSLHIRLNSPIQIIIKQLYVFFFPLEALIKDLFHFSFYTLNIVILHFSQVISYLFTAHIVEAFIVKTGVLEHAGEIHKEE